MANKYEIKVHAGKGGFIAGKGEYMITLTGKKQLRLPTQKRKYLGGEKIALKQLSLISIATEESVKKWSIGQSLAGGILLGPIGLLAGLVFGKKTKTITFTAIFKDGRSILATTSRGTFLILQSAAFSGNNN